MPNIELQVIAVPGKAFGFMLVRKIFFVLKKRIFVYSLGIIKNGVRKLDLAKLRVQMQNEKHV